MEAWQLKQRQGLPLGVKIRLTEVRIREWYEHWEGQVYVAFSGGRDSTVLLDIARGLYPSIPAVFVDTGLEYPEIKKFVKTIDNVITLRPKMPFDQVIEKYGYPVVSKIVAMGLGRYRRTKSEIQKNLRLYGGINPSSGKKQHPSIPKKWHFLKDAPFNVSEQCCVVMKKAPFVRYERESDRKPIIGTMASESRNRQLDYTSYGCNAFDLGKPRSTPIAFWTEEDIKAYIKLKQLPYSKIYDMGEERTGCMFCMFGVHLEKGENRFQRMARTHPKQYDYCINKLGIGKVLDFIGVDYQKRLF